MIYWEAWCPSDGSSAICVIFDNGVLFPTHETMGVICLP